MSKSLVALVGTKFRGREAMDMLASLPQGEPLTLVREPTNEFDPRCIQVWARGVHIGFVKKEQNKAIAERMDAERAGSAKPFTVTAKLAIDGGKQPMIEIG